MKVLLCVIFVLIVLLSGMLAGPPTFQRVTVEIRDEHLVLIDQSLPEPAMVPVTFIPWAVQEGEIVTISIIRRTGLTTLRRWRIGRKIEALRP